MTPEALAFWEYAVAFTAVVVVKLTCFVLGYLTIRLGHHLIASGVKGDFKFGGGLGPLKADLASVSPGLLFVLLGVILIGYAMGVDKGVTQKFEGGSTPRPVVEAPTGSLFGGENAGPPTTARGAGPP